jgi:hypothetical protein
MRFTREQFVNRLAAIFCDECKANGGDQVAAFEEVANSQTRSVKQQLRSILQERGYKDV